MHMRVIKARQDDPPTRIYGARLRPGQLFDVFRSPDGPDAVAVNRQCFGPWLRVVHCVHLRVDNNNVRRRCLRPRRAAHPRADQRQNK